MKMLPLTAALILASCFLGACATAPASQERSEAAARAAAAAKAAQAIATPPGTLLPLSEWKITVVTARTVVQVGDVRGISDKFNYEGSIHAHATLSAPPGARAGPHFFEMKWFNGEKLVATQRAQHDVVKSPYYLASSTSGTALGAGRCWVGLYANGVLLARKDFVVEAQ